MNTLELKEKYQRFIQSLTYEEHDLFTHIVEDHWKVMRLKNEVA